MSNEDDNPDIEEDSGEGGDAPPAGRGAGAGGAAVPLAGRGAGVGGAAAQGRSPHAGELPRQVRVPPGQPSRAKEPDRVERDLDKELRIRDGKLRNIVRACAAAHTAQAILDGP